METGLTKKQKEICEKYGANFLESPLDFKVGISYNFKYKLEEPINALRYFSVDGTTGWYICGMMIFL